MYRKMRCSWQGSLGLRGQCQGHKSCLVKAHHQHTVIKTAGLKSSHEITLRGHRPLISEPLDLTPHVISGPALLLFGGLLNPSCFYGAFHKELLSASSLFRLHANANKGCRGGCPSSANGCSLSLAFWIQSNGFTPDDAED